MSQQTENQVATEEVVGSKKVAQQFTQVCTQVGDLVFKTEYNKKVQAEIDDQLAGLKEKQRVLNAKYIEAVQKEQKAAQKAEPETAPIESALN
jgi:K+-transporting ATPase c subunit